MTSRSSQNNSRATTNNPTWTYATGARPAAMTAAQGLRVGAAEETILSHYGLAFPRHPRVCSALTLLLGLPAFGRYFLTREGARLSRLALGSISRGMGSMWTGANLVRNFVKRIGGHFLLEELRNQLRDYDVVIWDESHRCKNPAAARSKLAVKLNARAGFVLWLSATAGQNPIELSYLTPLLASATGTTNPIPASPVHIVRGIPNWDA